VNEREWTEEDRERMRAGQAEHAARRAALIERYGEPKPLGAADALALAAASGVHIDASVTAYQVHASLYRDAAQADAWLASNLEHYGHPTLARATLPDGRVVGILDMRPAIARAEQEAT
jgi:hypothetical protein